MNSLPTPELVVAATNAAAAFALPEHWRNDRLRATGYAIDDQHSIDTEDAIALAETVDGPELQVSIVDTGAFLREETRIAQLAWRRMKSQYNAVRAVRPMIPASISEDKLSLAHEQERPVVTIHISTEGVRSQDVPRLSRGVLRATRLDYAEVARLIENDDEAGLALRALEKVAHQLRATRSREGGTATELSEKKSDKRQAEGQAVGRIIVDEAMIAANAAMARFVHHHEIPALYWNQEQLDEIARQVHASDSIAQRLLARGWYEQIPRGHEGLGLEKYLHFTSPLRRFADFVNHANVAAFLDGQRYPYDSYALDKIASRMHIFGLREVEHTQRRRVAPRSKPIQVTADQSNT